MALILAVASTPGKAKERAPLLLGPPEAGTWSGSSKWPNGAYGSAGTFYDFDNSSRGICSFGISNTVPGKENRADWRCLPFSLGPASGGARPVTFSFAYELSGPVTRSENIRVLLRFYDQRTNYVGGRMLQVGAHTGDLTMTNFRTLAIDGIMPPKRARLADMTIIANIDEPWVSGVGRFDDFALTTIPGPPVRAMLLSAGAIGASAALAVFFLKRRRRLPGIPVSPPR